MFADDSLRDLLALLIMTDQVFVDLCDLLIKKGYITKEEYQRIVNDSKVSLKKSFMEEIENGKTGNNDD